MAVLTREYCVREADFLTWFPALVWGWPRCFLRRTRGAYESLRLLPWSSAAGMAAAESKHSHHPPLEAACQRVYSRNSSKTKCRCVCVCVQHSQWQKLKTLQPPLSPGKQAPFIRPSPTAGLLLYPPRWKTQQAKHHFYFNSDDLILFVQPNVASVVHQAGELLLAGMAARHMTLPQQWIKKRQSHRYSSLVSSREGVMLKKSLFCLLALAKGLVSVCS